MKPALTGFMAFGLMLWSAVAAAQTDADFERATGLDAALSDGPSVVPEASIEGSSHDVPDACGKRGCTATFQFPIAKKGSFPIPALGGQAGNGVYVRIDFTYDAVGCDLECEEVKAIQVIRYFARDAQRRRVSALPPPTEGEGLRARLGLGVANAKSPGWGVASETTSPYHGGPGTPAGSSVTGSTNTPLTVRDAPALPRLALPPGVTQYGILRTLCAVCLNSLNEGRLEEENGRHEEALEEIVRIDDEAERGEAWRREKERHDREFRRAMGIKKVIACVTWGFGVDRNNNVSFDPPNGPIFHQTPPPYFRDAVERFESLPGNEQSGIQW